MSYLLVSLRIEFTFIVAAAPLQAKNWLHILGQKIK